MIKINLIAEKKQTKAKKVSVGTPGMGAGPSMAQNLLLMAILVAGVGLSAIWWYSLSQSREDWERKHVEADRELERLTEIRAKGEEFGRLEEKLDRKIRLITDLKKRQTVPVHILDKVSRYLPDSLWLESMTANQNTVNISGKATNFNAVSNFYQNLADSGFFDDVTLGRTFEVREGVAFSLSCQFSSPAASEAEETETSPAGTAS